LSYRRVSNGIPGRTFSTCVPRHAAKSTTTTTTAPAADNNTTADPEKTARSLGWSVPPQSRAPQSGRRRSGNDEIFNGGSSAEMILDAFNQETSYISNNDTKIDISRMQHGRPQGVRNPLMVDLQNAMTPPKAMPRVPIDLKPITGRTVAIQGNIDLGRGFRLLEQSCARNRVRADFTKQRFHERGGMKRKRLRRERWKRKFMEGFRATVVRVKQLKNQGW
jgi:small subunit ribosomal protein MRP21